MNNNGSSRLERQMSRISLVSDVQPTVSRHFSLLFVNELLGRILTGDYNALSFDQHRDRRTNSISSSSL